VEGPMGRNISDMALLLGVQAGYDPRAPLSLDGERSFLERIDVRPPGRRRVGWLADLGGHLPMEAGVLDLCAAALRRMQDASFDVEPVTPDFDFPKLWQAFATLRHATSGCALKVHYDDPARRALL